MEITTEENDDGITDPAETPVVSVQGTTMVVRTETVVTGTVGAGVITPVTVTVVAPVTMAGFWGTYGAQMPWK